MAALFGLLACAKAKPSAPAPVGDSHRPPVTMARPETVSVRDPELDRRVAALELQLLAKDAEIDALSKQLDDARQEVVRSMAKLRTLASRAEAASGMAEAEIAVQSLESKAERSMPELAQAEQLLQMSSTEFNGENYGGALYLANQAKAAAKAGEDRLLEAQQVATRPGEVVFTVPVPLRLVSRGNVRDGPGAGFRVLFTLASGALIVGHSYANEWVRIIDEDGRVGWVTKGSVAGRR